MHVCPAAAQGWCGWWSGFWDALLVLVCASVYVVAVVLVFWGAVVVVVSRSSVGMYVVALVRLLALEAWGCVPALLLACLKRQFLLMWMEVCCVSSALVLSNSTA
jgi:hypothetical protein